MPEKVFVVFGANDLLNNVQPVGAATTREAAEDIAKENEWFLDRYNIIEVEFRA